MGMDISRVGFLRALGTIKKLQEDIRSALKSLRFTRTNYRWYEYKNKITYNIIFEGEDLDLVN